MTGPAEWRGRVGESWAELWQQTDRSFAPVTQALLDHPACRTFAQALDIGCGAGELACALADRSPDAAVVGVDLSEDLLTVARARCPAVRFIAHDAASFSPSAPPDLLVSRHGVMFFADPTAAFVHLAAVAAPSARLLFSCFREREDNGWATRLGEAVGAGDAGGDPRAPGPFAFGDPDHVRTILESAGWEEVALTPLDYAMVAGSGEDALEEALGYFQRIGPAARALGTLEGEARVLARERLRALLADAQRDGRVELPAAAWIVTATAPR